MKLRQNGRPRPVPGKGRGALAKRRAGQKAYEREFFSRVIHFLNFHPRYEKAEALLAKDSYGEEITAHDRDRLFLIRGF